MCPCGTIDLKHPNSNPCPEKYSDPIPCANTVDDTYDTKYIGDYSVSRIQCYNKENKKNEYYPKPAIVSF